jgi:hypothetical protein
VQEHIDRRFGDRQLAVDLHLVALPIRPCTEFADHVAIDPHPSGEDQLFGVTARGDAGASENLLQTFEGHRFLVRIEWATRV